MSVAHPVADPARGRSALRRWVAHTVPVGLVVRMRVVPWWGRVLAVFAASRVVTTIIMLGWASVEKQNFETGPHPDYVTFANIWDGRWYALVAYSGYPTTLPLDDTGHVAQNAWAFLPAYPALVGLFSRPTGIPFSVVGIFVAVAFALAAALVFYRLMVRFLPSGTALYATALLCFGPVSPVFQVSYAESMALFLLLCALVLLLERNYLTLLPIVGVWAFTRPGAIAFALLLLAHLVHRFLTRRDDPFPWGERIRLVVAGLVTAALGFAWPVIAWIATGNRDAYTDTELAWRASYIGYSDLVPFTAWFQGVRWWMTHEWGVSDDVARVLSVVGVVALAVGVLAALFTPWARRIGVDLRLWLASYVVYLLAVFFPQSSVFRILLPMAPALGAFAVPKSRIYRTLLILLGIVGQVLWIYAVWWIDVYDWTPP